MKACRTAFVLLSSRTSTSRLTLLRTFYTVDQEASLAVMSRPSSSVGLSKSAPDLTGVRSHSGHGKRKKKDVLQTSRDFSKDEIKRGPPLPDSAKDSGLSPLNDLLFDPSKLLGEQRAKVLEQSKMPGAGAAWLPTESLPPVRNAAARRRAVAAGSNQTARDLKEENERARAEMADGVRALAETLSQLKFVADKKQRELSKLRDDIRNLKISAREDDSSPLPGVAPALFERACMAIIAFASNCIGPLFSPRRPRNDRPRVIEEGTQRGGGQY